MAVNEKRINLIEKKMVLHDEQIARVFSDITDIRDSHNEMVKMFVHVRGMFIGGIIIIVLLQVGVLDAIKLMM